MRKVLLIGAVVAAPVLFGSSGAFACFGYGYGYGYGPAYYGYSSYAPRYYRYSYAPRWRFYGPRAYGYRAGLGVRRVGWRGGRRW
jgi:hypothetical protein